MAVSITESPIVPNLYSPSSAISFNVSNGTMYLSTVRNAIRLPLYVATITMQKSHQNPTKNLADAVIAEKYPPIGNQKCHCHFFVFRDNWVTTENGTDHVPWVNKAPNENKMLSLKSPNPTLRSCRWRAGLSLVMANTTMAQNGIVEKIGSQTSGLNGFK